MESQVNVLGRNFKKIRQMYSEIEEGDKRRRNTTEGSIRYATRYKKNLVPSTYPEADPDQKMFKDDELGDMNAKFSEDVQRHEEQLDRLLNTYAGNTKKRLELEKDNLKGTEEWYSIVAKQMTVIQDIIDSYE
jgi:hypothetical protein